jgi:hypothetical protein
MVLLRDFTVDARVNERSSQKFRHTPRQLPLYAMTLANQKRAQIMPSCSADSISPDGTQQKSALSVWAFIVGE